MKIVLMGDYYQVYFDGGVYVRAPDMSIWQVYRGEHLQPVWNDAFLELNFQDLIKQKSLDYSS